MEAEGKYGGNITRFFEISDRPSEDDPQDKRDWLVEILKENQELTSTIEKQKNEARYKYARRFFCTAIVSLTFVGVALILIGFEIPYYSL